MYRSGHIGFSMFLASIFVFILLQIEFYVLAGVFLGLFVFSTLLPDVDMKLRHFADFIEHRGITHSIHFAVFMGILYSSIAIIITLLIYVGGNFETIREIQAITNTHIFVVYIVIFMSGVLGVISHLIGDIFTPTGVSIRNPYQTTGYSVDLFKAKNEVANATAIPLGVTALVFGSLLSQNTAPIQSSILFSLGLSILFICWLLLINTKIGTLIYQITSYIYKKL